MALVDQKKKKNQNRVRKTKGMQLPGTSSLASIESLAIPLVSFLSWNFQGSTLFLLSDHHQLLLVNQVQEVVFLADFRCANCQQRVAEAMAKMNGKGFFLTTTLEFVDWLFFFSFLGCIQIKRALSPTIPANIVKFTVVFFPKIKIEWYCGSNSFSTSLFKHWIPVCNYFWSSSFLELPFGSHCSFFFFRKWNKPCSPAPLTSPAGEQTVIDFLGGCGGGAFRLLKND